MQLSQSEEELMQFIWEQEKAFMKDLLEMYPAPKPAATTVATLLKRMTKKGYVGYDQVGRSRQYYPLVTKSDHFSKRINGLIKKLFDNSASEFASFFTSETNLSKQELEELKGIIEQEIQKKK